MTSAEAHRLGAVYRQLTDQNEALEAPEARPGALLLLVRVFGRTANSDALSPLFFDIGRRACHPIWDRFIWPPQETLLQSGGGAASLRAGDLLAAEYPMRKTRRRRRPRWHCSQPAPRDGIDWLMRPWVDVFGAAPER
jgi:hypothetical protein